MLARARAVQAGDTTTGLGLLARLAREPEAIAPHDATGARNTTQKTHLLPLVAHITPPIPVTALPRTMKARTLSATGDWLP